MQILNIFHVLIAIAMVALVLVQRGAGATVGAAFGSGASSTVFGARGAGNFLTRSTWVLATLFCAISLTMAVVVSRTSTKPTTDLGVVSTAPAAARQAEETPPVRVESLPSEDAAADLPPLEIPEESGSGRAAGDLPAFDGASDAPGETSSSESDSASAEDDS